MNASHAQQRKPAEPPREGRLLVFPRVSPCEPLCARLGAGVACVPDEGCFAHARRTLRRYKNGKYAAVTRGRPAFQQHEARTEGSDTAPHTEVPKKHCVQEGTACPSAQSTHSEKAVFLPK